MPKVSEMIQSKYSVILLGGTAALALLSHAAPAFAQEQSTVGEVVVTGSRIARRDYVAESPIVTVSPHVSRRASSRHRTPLTVTRRDCSSFRTADHDCPGNHRRNIARIVSV